MTFKRTRPGEYLSGPPEHLGIFHGASGWHLVGNGKDTVHRTLREARAASETEGSGGDDDR